VRISLCCSGFGVRIVGGGGWWRWKGGVVLFGGVGGWRGVRFTGTWKKSKKGLESKIPHKKPNDRFVGKRRSQAPKHKRD